MLMPHSWAVGRCITAVSVLIEHGLQYYNPQMKHTNKAHKHNSQWNMTNTNELTANNSYIAAYAAAVFLWGHCGVPYLYKQILHTMQNLWGILALADCS